MARTQASRRRNASPGAPHAHSMCDKGQNRAQLAFELSEALLTGLQAAAMQPLGQSSVMDLGMITGAAGCPVQQQLPAQ